jgi:Fur family peroxide stress response transcriptional regulator
MKSQDDAGAARLQDLEERARTQGLALTPQRRTVLEALVGAAEHLSADEVFAAVRGRLPGISRSTVYRILDALAGRGIVRQVFHPGATARYDGVAERHHHVVCARCGRIRDWRDARFDNLAIPRDVSKGFEVLDYSVYVHGVCADCREDPKPSTATSKGEE